MEWKPIKGYEKEYSVNRHGEVMRNETKKILRPSVAKNGYLVVSLWKNNKGKTHYIHRLIAEHFIPPYHGETVNHKDGNKTNNELSNLEWSTYSGNNKHAYDAGLRTITPEHSEKLRRAIIKRNKNDTYRSIPIEVYKLNGDFVGRFESIKEATEALGISRKPIYEGLRNRVQSRLYKFEYAEGE